MSCIAVRPIHNQVLSVITLGEDVEAEDVQQRLEEKGITLAIKTVRKTLCELCDMHLMGGGENPATYRDEFWKCE